MIAKMRIQHLFAFFYIYFHGDCFDDLSSSVNEIYEYNRSKKLAVKSFDNADEFAKSLSSMLTVYFLDFLTCGNCFWLLNIH